MKNRKKNPLNNRFVRDLRDDLGKYVVIAFLMILTIGFVSGFLVADSSMIKAYDESFTKYNVEDGNFRTQKKMNRAQWKSVEGLGLSLYEIFYREFELDNGSTIRVFQNRDKVNLVCLMQGEFPDEPGEIAVDRMYADNNGLKVGDRIRRAGGDTGADKAAAQEGADKPAAPEDAGKAAAAEDTAGWRINLNNLLGNASVNEYNEYLQLGNEIKEMLLGMRQEIRREVQAQNAPKQAVVCPLCGATTIPDENNCCEYCGGALG